jgi:hypothetical protein
VLPGGAMPAGGLDDFVRREIAPRYPWLPAAQRDALARRHGSELPELLGAAQGPEELGEDFGGGLCERELEWMLAREWARSGRRHPLAPQQVRLADDAGTARTRGAAAGSIVGAGGTATDMLPEAGRGKIKAGIVSVHVIRMGCPS